jgi:flagellar motor switch protein FliG
VSQTGNVDPETVRRIGLSLASQLDQLPPKAFDAGPVERVGAILNVSPALTRDDVLQGLQETDSEFAELVRRAIFTFVHLPKRVLGRDIPKIIRLVDQPVLVTALAACDGRDGLQDAADFVLSNVSQRMAQGLREEMAARGRVKEKEAEAAMASIITAVHQLEAAGEIALIREED